MLELARSLVATTAVACTHGDLIPELLDGLERTDGLPMPPGYRCQKGSTWVLEVDERGRYATATYLRPVS